MPRDILRGDIYYADLESGVGSEQKGCRPVVVIQNNLGNKYSPTVIVAAVSSKVAVKSRLPTHCFVEAGNGLNLPSVILLEQLRTIDKHRLKNYIGHLSNSQLKGVNHALAVSIGLSSLTKQPPQKTL